MGRKQQSEGRLRAFFKVYLPTSAKRIGIPIAYASYMKGNIQRRAFLRHQDGKVWPVKVNKIENEFFFVDGWEKYVNDNSLERGDFLVFQHDGHSLYDVTLLGKSGTNKETTEIKKEAQVVEVLDETEEEEEKEVEEVRRREKLGKRVAVGDASSSQRHLKKSRREEPGKFKCHGEVEANRSECKRTRPLKYGRPDIFRSGLVPRPTNPHFLTSIRRKRRDELYIPTNFIRDHCLNLPSMITLQDQNGRRWRSELTPWKDGRMWYYGGWARLCRINMVGENDICICELKGGSNGILFFQVQIVREDMIENLVGRSRQSS